MDKFALVALVVSVYLAATLAVGLLAGRRASKSVQGYVAGDRGFGLVVMYFITGASVFSAFAFLGGPGWAYSRGAAAFYILSYGVLGMAPWYAMGPKVAALGRQFGFVTQAQLLTGRFPSRGLSALMAALTLAAFVPYVTIQIRGAGIVMEAVTGGRVPLWAGAAAAYGVVMVYVLASGVSAVGWTNAFQGVFMLAIAWTLGLYLPTKLYGGVGPMFEQILSARPELLSFPGLDSAGAPWTWGAYSTAILVSAIGFTMLPHLFMKAFTAKDDRTIRRTVILFPTFQLFLIPVFLIGFAGVLFPEAPPSADTVLPFLVVRTELPALVVGLFCAGVLSASMSTGDALLHARGVRGRGGRRATLPEVVGRDATRADAGSRGRGGHAGVRAGAGRKRFAGGPAAGVLRNRLPVHASGAGGLVLEAGNHCRSRVRPDRRIGHSIVLLPMPRAQALRHARGNAGIARASADAGNRKLGRQTARRGARGTLRRCMTRPRPRSPGCAKKSWIATRTW